MSSFRTAGAPKQALLFSHFANDDSFPCGFYTVNLWAGWKNIKKRCFTDNVNLGNRWVDLIANELGYEERMTVCCDETKSFFLVPKICLSQWSGACSDLKKDSWEKKKSLCVKSAMV